MGELLTNHRGVEVEAWWSMEMAPGVNPSPGRVPEQELLTPETEFRMAAEHGDVFGIMMICARVYTSGALSSPKGSSGSVTEKPHPRRARSPPRPRPGRVWGLWAPPGTCPSGSGSLLVKYLQRKKIRPIPRILVFWPFCNKQT